jgi:enoyl-CoA hydratase
MGRPGGLAEIIRLPDNVKEGAGYKAHEGSYFGEVMSMLSGGEMTDEVKIEREQGVLQITLNRPEHGNALTPAMTDAIAAAVTHVDAEVRVIHLRAEGNDFCTGRAAVLPKPGTRITAHELRGTVSDPVLDFYQAVRDAPVPVVAEVRGRAEGVGCALAALADVAIAAEDAVFAVPEMNRDIAPTLVMDALADRLPRAALARLVLTRDPVGAEEAKALGIIGMVVAGNALAAEATRIVDKLAGNSAVTVRSVKAFLARAPESSRATRRELAALLNAAAAAEKYR